MTWETISAKRNEKPRSMPYARVGRGSIVLNSATFDLLGSVANREFAELMLDLDDGRVGIRFLDGRTEYSLPIHRKKNKGKPTKSLAISSKAHMRELFGQAGVSSDTIRYNVSIDPEERNVLVLTLSEQ